MLGGGGDASANTELNLAHIRGARPHNAPDAQVALTLRTLGGLTTAEIARAAMADSHFLRSPNFTVIAPAARGRRFCTRRNSQASTKIAAMTSTKLSSDCIRLVVSTSVAPINAAYGCVRSG